MFNSIKFSLKNLVQFILLISVMIGLVFLGTDIWLILSVGIWSIMFFSCLENVRINGFLLFFLLSFFVFLMSGDIAELLFDKHYYLQFGKEATLHAHKCIFISLLAMWIGYIFTKSKRKEKDLNIQELNNSTTTINGIKQFSKWAVYSRIFFYLNQYNRYNKICGSLWIYCLLYIL